MEIEMEKLNIFIELIEKLSKILFINNIGISIITLFSVYLGYYLTVVLKEKKETKKILDCVHYEIKNNLLNSSETIRTINSLTKRWKILSNVSGNVFRSKIGNLIISPEQIQSILKTYKYFDLINDEIVNIRKNTKYPEVEMICNKTIQNYYSDCKEEINRYQERWKPSIDLEKFENINEDIKNPNIGKTLKYLGGV
jgi:hypothetical protein